MRTKIFVYPFVLVVLLALTLAAGCGSGDDDTSSTPSGTSAGQSGQASIGHKKGDTAPDFTLESLSGGEFTLSDVRGKAVLIDFWDTWCPPCRKAMPHLQELSETYGDDLVVVGVAFGREGEAAVRNFTKANGLTFEMVLYNEKSTILSDFGDIQSLPTTFLIDADGVIREKWVGAAPMRAYENAVVAAINKHTQSS